jgi:hypothetical protein
MNRIHFVSLFFWIGGMVCDTFFENMKKAHCQMTAYEILEEFVKETKKLAVSQNHCEKTAFELLKNSCFCQNNAPQEEDLCESMTCEK